MLIIFFGPFKFEGNEEPESKDDDGRDDVGRQGSPPNPEFLKRKKAIISLLTKLAMKNHNFSWIR